MPRQIPAHSDLYFNELERLSTAFGVIRIDIDDPDSTAVIFPARSKNVVDWDTINKLTFNPDFRDLLKRIKIDIQSREIWREMYDVVLSKDELVNLLAKKK